MQPLSTTSALESGFDLLKDEGLTDGQITLERDRVIRTDDGIVSWRIESGYPYIAHFVTTRPRSFDKGLRLYFAFRTVIGKNQRFIAEVIPEKAYFEKLIRFIDKDAYHYATSNNIKYFLLRASR